MTREQTRTYVDADVKARFEQRFGGYGATSFVLETAMRELLDITEGQPDIEELVRQTIRTYVLKRKLEASNSQSDAINLEQS